VCGEFTLAGWQVPTWPLCCSPPELDEQEKKHERLVGRDKDRQITHQLLSRAKQTQLGEINLFPIKSE